jgi:hypothetical protein
VRPFWQALYELGGDVVLSAHTHLYERFAPQDPNGESDAARGVRQFTVGTGGGGLYRIAAPAAHSEFVAADTHGVLKLTLRPAGYDWEFVAVDGSTRDSGSGLCHPRSTPR